MCFLEDLNLVDPYFFLDRRLLFLFSEEKRILTIHNHRFTIDQPLVMSTAGATEHYRAVSAQAANAERRREAGCRWLQLMLRSAAVH